MLYFRKKFRVQGLIGEGLNAKVYKAIEHDPEYGIEETYALKVLKRKEDVGHFKKEYQNLLKASGRHIVKFRGWKRYKSRPALLLEFIEGITLHELLQTSTLLPDESSWIYQETLCGLQELKESQLFHGDLSPNNIMIDTKGQVKLIDFGLSIWRTRKIEVTPEFASPSVLDGRSNPNYHTDTTSLNLIFEKFSLAKTSSNPLSSPPPSLLHKVLHIMGGSSEQTACLDPSQEEKPFSIYSLKSSLLPVFIISLCSMFSIKAPVFENKKTLVHIRSTSWLSVKTPDGKWCFTPCSLQLTRKGYHNILWKRGETLGNKTIFVSSDEETVLISL